MNKPKKLPDKDQVESRKDLWGNGRDKIPERLKKYGDVSNLIAVRVDAKTIKFVKPKKTS